MGELNITWRDFGFPNPCLLPPWLPAEGLTKALAERTLPFQSDWDSDIISSAVPNEYFKKQSGQEWCRIFDQNLKSIAVRYLNHTKVESNKDITLSSIRWSWEDLLLAAADGDAEKIADPLVDYLSPEWNLTWIKQRYNAINLLLYAPVGYLCERKEGHINDDSISSRIEAISKAFANATEYDVEHDIPFCRVFSEVELSTSNKYYTADFWITSKIYVDLPAIFPKQHSVGKAYLYLEVVGVDESDESFAGGQEKISIGNNLLASDDNGVFVEFNYSEKDFAEFAFDHEGEDYGGLLRGWLAYNSHAFVNYQDVFCFTDNKESSQ